MQIGLLLIGLAAISWGTTGTTLVLLQRVVVMNPLVVGFWRMAFAAPLLLLLASQSQPKRQLAQADWLTYLGMGTCIAAYQVCYFAAVPLAGVAVTALVAICSAPLFVALLAAWRLGERLTAKMCAALALGLTGTTLLISGPQLTIAPNFPTGVVLALGSGLSYAAYAVIAKAQVAKTPPIQVAAIGFSAAAVWLLPAIMLQSSWSDWWLALPYLLYLGVIATGIAYAIYMIGLRTVPVTIASITTLLEPLTAALIGVYFFQEPLGPLGVVGAGLLVAAIALLSVNPKWPKATGNHDS